MDKLDVNTLKVVPDNLDNLDCKVNEIKLIKKKKFQSTLKGNVADKDLIDPNKAGLFERSFFLGRMGGG